MAQKTCAGQFCDLIRTLDPNHDLHFFRNTADIKLRKNGDRNIERSHERARAFRIVKFVLANSELARMDESGQLIKLRISGRIDPFAFKRVPSHWLSTTRKEHRRAFADLAVAEDSDIMSIETWTQHMDSYIWNNSLSNSTESITIFNKKENGYNIDEKVDTADSVQVCQVCFHLYRLLNLVRSLLSRNPCLNEWYLQTPERNTRFYQNPTHKY